MWGNASEPISADNDISPRIFGVATWGAVFDVGRAMAAGNANSNVLRWHLECAARRGRARRTLGAFLTRRVKCDIEVIHCYLRTHRNLPSDYISRFPLGGL